MTEERMTEDVERELLRRLAGELDEAEARRLDERLTRDPELARRAGRLAAAWRAAGGSPVPPVPPGFAGRVMARVREEESARGAWLPTPRLRWAGAAALVAGLVLGGGLGRLAGPELAEPGAPPAARTAAGAPERAGGTAGAAPGDLPAAGAAEAAPQVASNDAAPAAGIPEAAPAGSRAAAPAADVADGGDDLAAAYLADSADGSFTEQYLAALAAMGGEES